METPWLKNENCLFCLKSRDWVRMGGSYNVDSKCTESRHKFIKHNIPGLEVTKEKLQACLEAKNTNNESRIKKDCGLEEFDFLNNKNTNNTEK